MRFALPKVTIYILITHDYENKRVRVCARVRAYAHLDTYRHVHAVVIDILYSWH